MWCYVLLVRCISFRWIFNSLQGSYSFSNLTILSFLRWDLNSSTSYLLLPSFLPLESSQYFPNYHSRLPHLQTRDSNPHQGTYHVYPLEYSNLWSSLSIYLWLWLSKSTLDLSWFLLSLLDTLESGKAFSISQPRTVLYLAICELSYPSI